MDCGCGETNDETTTSYNTLQSFEGKLCVKCFTFWCIVFGLALLTLITRKK